MCAHQCITLQRRELQSRDSQTWAHALGQLQSTTSLSVKELLTMRVTAVTTHEMSARKGANDHSGMSRSSSSRFSDMLSCHGFQRACRKELACVDMSLSSSMQDGGSPC